MRLITRVLYPVVVSLSSMTYSCNGHVNRTIAPESSSGNQDINQHTISADDYWKNQISQVVRMIFQDSKGTLWFGTQDGAFQLIHDSLIILDKIESESGGRITIRDITENIDGTIWFAHTGGLSSYDGKSVENYYMSDGLISNDVWNVSSDSQGNIWIGTIDGACKFDGTGFTGIELPEGTLDTTLGVSSTKMVHCILEDRTGDIWFCSNAGLHKLSRGNLIDISKKAGIETNFVDEILESKRGGYYISTKTALYKLQGDELENITASIPETGKGAGSMAEDKEGKLWFVFNQHQLFTCDGKTINEFIKTEDNKGPVVYQIFKDQSDRLWFCGFGGAFRLENGQFIHVTKNGPW